ncbi:uncharacterized protein LOC131876211 [Cryptomeria japonica]|uniref:uncharacterized protein LOC131876211 n=1 Tax=Cryptomeria japonica TaxID=3369 RepID=UPI0027DAA147|nr:uncharacterized protein LOC131876211 [Cryptomeria japonica]
MQVLVCLADNVGSNQLQSIRQGLRPDSLLVGNVGLIFTKGDLKEVREEVAKYKVGAPAPVGLVAPVDVVVPPGNTGIIYLDPKERNNTEYKLETFAGVYRKFCGKNEVFEYPLFGPLAAASLVGGIFPVKLVRASSSVKYLYDGMVFSLYDGMVFSLDTECPVGFKSLM